jgi:hypothetical protein
MSGSASDHIRNTCVNIFEFFFIFAVLNKIM